ncbi:MAG: hypothetical protein LBU36_07365 [Clostridiales bacterium]|nr:hypothetical protein [Clostridiales bacterium]
MELKEALHGWVLKGGALKPVNWGCASGGQARTVVKLYAARPAPPPVFQFKISPGPAPAGDRLYNLFHRMYAYPSIRGTGVELDWGDGKTITINAPNSFNQPVHFYDDETREYIVTLRNLDGLTGVRVAENGYLTEILTPIPRAENSALQNFADKCGNLKKIPENLLGAGVSAGADRLTSAFYACAALTMLPPDLLKGAGGVRQFNNAFAGCAGLTEIPAGFFDGCVSAEVMFCVFMNCAGLKSIPPGLFANLPGITDFTGAFLGCSGITGPVPRLWNSHPGAEHVQTFLGCVNASNYDEIPAGWK